MEENGMPLGQHIESVLKADLEKYITKILSHAGTANIRGSRKKEPALRDIPGTPVENFPLWRKSSFEDELSFWTWKYENTIWPPEEIRERETERVCKNINELYPLQIQQLTDEELTQDYYQMAMLIGKFDYLKYISTVQKNRSTKFENYCTVNGRKLIPWITKEYRDKLKPRQVAMVLLAMKEIDCLAEDLQDIPITHLAASLKPVFGDILARSLSGALRTAERLAYTNRIASYKKALLKALK